MDEIAIDSLCRVVAPEGYTNDFWSSALSLDGKQITDVVHLGDSHVQGGYFTIPIRQALDHIIGGAGIGWVGPYRLLRTNEPRHARLSSRTRAWQGDQIIRRRYSGTSPTGIVLRSTSNSAQKVRIYGEKREFISRALLLHKEGVDTLDFRPPVTEVEITIPPRMEWYGAILQNAESGVLTHTIGHNGASYYTYVKHDFAHYFAKLHPRLIIISLGTNDALVRNFSQGEMRSYARQFVRQLQREIPDAKIILTTPIYAKWQWTMTNPNCKQVAAIIREVAMETGVGYIDLFEIFGGEAGAAQLINAGIVGRDHIHLTQDGYLAMGRAVALALQRDFARCMGEVPTGLIYRPSNSTKTPFTK